MISLFYRWGTTIRRVTLDPLPGNLFARHAAVRLKDGSYRLLPFAGYISLMDLDQRSWQRLKVKCDFLDCLPTHNQLQIESGHVLGACFRGRVFVVLDTSNRLVIEVGFSGS